MNLAGLDVLRGGQRGQSKAGTRLLTRRGCKVTLAVNGIERWRWSGAST